MRVRGYLHQHLADPELSPDQIAAVQHISVSAFRAAYGMPPKDFRHLAQGAPSSPGPGNVPAQR